MSLIVDSFAGGGGASLGIEMALGRSPHIAINHDREAIALHAANHPRSTHYAEDVWRVDPVAATKGQRVRLMWLSPDCTHHSKARGGKPRKKKIRGLAWVAVRWASSPVRPEVIVLENVEEFQTWGPLLSDGTPCPARKGKTFRAFVSKLRRLGYEVDHRELRACDFGAPTIRKRLFLIARCDGQPIVWPTPTHGKGRPLPWRTAAECIEWRLPCPSIFERKRPLKDNTLKRIARGLRRFVIEGPKPFIVNMANGGSIDDVRKPFTTIMTERGGARALVAPMLVETAHGEVDRNGKHRSQKAPDITAPLGTVLETGNHSLVAAFLAKHYGERKPNEVMGASLFDPAPTVTSVDHSALVTSHIEVMHGNSAGASMADPMQTIMGHANHFAEVRAFMVAYYGNEKDGGSLFDPMRTVTSKDRLGLVTVQGVEYAISDIGMRMLAPRELYRAQGFPDSYRIDIEFNGKPLTKTAQVRMCGNSVAPPIAAAIVRANLLQDTIEAAA